MAACAPCHRLALLIAVFSAAPASRFIYSGVYDVAATDPHWPLTQWILETARMRSIKAHAAGITVPPELDDPAKIADRRRAFRRALRRLPRRARRAQRRYRQRPLSAAAGSGHTRRAAIQRAELFWISSTASK